MSFENTRHYPIGTLAEITDAGMDPQEVGCCHANTREVRGCPVYGSCRFNLKNRGGFKGQGAKYVGYHMRTSKTDGRRQKEDFITCFGFVATLQARMESGMAAKIKGEDYEHIKIIAQEGEEIWVKRYTSDAPDGGNRSGNIKINEQSLKIEVPAFPRPGQNPEVAYNDILNARAERRDAAEEWADEEHADNVRASMEDDVDTSAPLGADAPDLSDDGVPEEAMVPAETRRNKKG